MMKHWYNSVKYAESTSTKLRRTSMIILKPNFEPAFYTDSLTTLITL